MKNSIQHIFNASILVYKFSPRGFLYILILHIIEALTAGAGFLLLIPLFKLTGLHNVENVTSREEGQIADLVNGLGLSMTIGQVLAIYFVIISVVAIIQYISSVRIVSIEQQYIAYLRRNLYSSMVRCRWEYFAEQNVSHLVNTLTTQVQLAGSAARQIVILLSQLILTFILVIISFFVSWEATLFALGCGLLLIIIIMPINGWVFFFGRSYLTSFKNVFQIIFEQFSILKLVKSHAIEDKSITRLVAESEDIKNQNISLARYQGIAKLVAGIFGALVISSMVYVSYSNYSVSFAKLLVVLIIFSRIWNAISKTWSSMHNLLHHIPSLDNIYVVLKNCYENIDNDGIPHDFSNLSMEKNFRLEDISFEYKDNGEVIQIFNNVCIEVEFCKTTAIIGSSGVGKTTLMDLICGLLTPTRGKMFCDYVELDSSNIREWRKNIAYVAQGLPLFNGTIRENIIYFVSPNNSISEDDIRDVIEMVDANFVYGLKDGLDTSVGESGVKLSGGQKQRLILARALLTKPKLLILDEATSSLDDKNENVIRETLEKLKGNITILFVAHRSAIINSADRIINVDEIVFKSAL